MSNKVLLLLNARREWTARDKAADQAISTIACSLASAREQGWGIVHAFHPNPHAIVRGAIEGLEPRAGEPLIAITQHNALLSITENIYAGRRLYLAGHVFSRAGLATALAASDFRCSVAFIEDAVLPSAEAASVWPRMIPPIIWPVRSTVLFNADSAVVNFADARACETN